MDFEFEEIVSGKVSDLIDHNLDNKWAKPGVWVLFEKKAGESVYRDCLEVAETANIKKELEYDFKLLARADSKDEIKCKRFRTWSIEFFRHEKEPRRHAKWRDIANKYDEICAKFVAGSNTWDKQTRLKNEAIIACYEKAKYFYPAPRQWEIIKNIEQQKF